MQVQQHATTQYSIPYTRYCFITQISIKILIRTCFLAFLNCKRIYFLKHVVNFNFPTSSSPIVERLNGTTELYEFLQRKITTVLLQTHFSLDNPQIDECSHLYNFFRGVIKGRTKQQNGTKCNKTNKTQQNTKNFVAAQQNNKIFCCCTTKQQNILFQHDKTTKYFVQTQQNNKIFCFNTTKHNKTAKYFVSPNQNNKI